MQHETTTKPWSVPVSLAAAEWGLAAGALPAIAVGMSAPIGLAHWVLMAHYLAIAYGCHVLRTTRLFPDRRTLRRNGFLLLVAGSLACAAAPDAYTLVAARLPQAFGIACLLAAQPVGSGLPVIPSIVGLLAGSLIGNLIGWRAVFLAVTMIGMVVGIRDWRREEHGGDSPEKPAPEHPSQRHPMLLACGLACIIVPFNSYCDFRRFGVAEAVLMLVGVVLFTVYARETIRSLIANRSPMLNLWLGAVVGGLCLLPALFHIQQIPAAVPAVAVVVCGLVLRLARFLPPRASRSAPMVGFLMLAGVCWAASFPSSMESPPMLAAAGVIGGGLGFAWTGCPLRPVPVCSGLAVGVYAASYFLEFIPASFGSLESSAAREFLRQETAVLQLAVGVACVGMNWSIVCARGKPGG
jgi:hypothetical protein